jgi:hypothetical protein
MPDNNDQFQSLNEETGLLEDKEEIRLAAAQVADILQTILKNPMIQLFTGFGLLLDTASFAVSMESMFRPMSQAEYYERLGDAMGIDPVTMRLEIAAKGLSRTLPITHPQAPTMNLPPLDPNNPLVRSSSVLSAIAKEERKPKESTRQEQTKPEERVDLPDNLEGFLRDLMNKEMPDQGKD